MAFVTEVFSALGPFRFVEQKSTCDLLGTCPGSPAASLVSPEQVEDGLILTFC